MRSSFLSFRLKSGLPLISYAFLVGAATGSRTRGRSVPEPEWSVGGLKLGVAATKSGLPRKVWWEPFWAERAAPRAGGYKPLVPPPVALFETHSENFREMDGVKCVLCKAAGDQRETMNAL